MLFFAKKHLLVLAWLIYTIFKTAHRRLHGLALVYGLRFWFQRFTLIINTISCGIIKHEYSEYLNMFILPVCISYFCWCIQSIPFTVCHNCLLILSHSIIILNFIGTCSLTHNIIFFNHYIVFHLFEFWDMNLNIKTHSFNLFVQMYICTLPADFFYYPINGVNKYLHPRYGSKIHTGLKISIFSWFLPKKLRKYHLKLSTWHKIQMSSIIFQSQIIMHSRRINFIQ